MPNQKAKVSQADLTRYLKAYRDAGIPIARTEIGKDGKVVIFSIAEASEKEPNEWDAI